MSGTQSVSRAPRLRLLANGRVVIGAVRLEVESNNHYACDRVSGEVSLSADPAFGLGWWGSQTDIKIEAQMAVMAPGAGSPAWQSLTVATVDSLDTDITTNSLRFEARDMTARFLETKIQKTFANQTSSQIAQTLAAGHGMTADVQATKTIVGQYYQLEHDRVSLDNFSHQTTEWDLLTYLAQQEDYDVWVTGNTLHFKPVTSSNSGVPFVVQYEPGPVPILNVERLRLERSLTLAKDIQVTVKTTNLRTGKAYARVVRANGAKTATPLNSTVQSYVFLKPGLTPDQALQYAQQKLNELTRHERIVTIEMPGELNLTARSMVQVTGTGSTWDQTYYIDTLTRSMDWTQGFTQSVRCKNTSPRNQVTVS